jgi:hypothetical protein
VQLSGSLACDATLQAAMVNMDQSSKNVASAAFIGAYMLLLVVLRPFQELKIMVRLAPSSPLPHQCRDRSRSLNWAHPCHICTGTGLAPATSAPEMGSALRCASLPWYRACVLHADHLRCCRSSMHEHSPH